MFSWAGPACVVTREIYGHGCSPGPPRDIARESGLVRVGGCWRAAKPLGKNWEREPGVSHTPRAYAVAVDIVRTGE